MNAAIRWKNTNDGRLLADLVLRYHAEHRLSGLQLFATSVPEVKFNAELERVLPVIVSALRWPQSTSPTKREQLVLEGSAIAARAGDINHKTLLAGILEARARCSPPRNREFCVVGSLLVPKSLPISRRKLGGNWFSFSNKLAPRWDRSAIEPEFGRLFPKASLDAGKQVVATVRARSAGEAMNVAIESLDQLRGLWSLHQLAGRWRMTVGTPKPKGPFTWGPVLTVHTSRGKLASNQFRYDEEQRSPRKPERVQDEANMISFERRALRVVNRSPFRETLEQLLVGYARALDHSRDENCFLALWALLEQAMGGDQAKSDVRLSRIAACYRVDETWRAYLGLELLHVRDFRNALVHHGQSRADTQKATQQLLGHVNAALQALLFTLSAQPSLDAALQCLDLPVDEQRLRQQRNQTDLMLRLRASQR